MVHLRDSHLHAPVTNLSLVGKSIISVAYWPAMLGGDSVHVIAVCNVHVTLFHNFSASRGVRWVH